MDYKCDYLHVCACDGKRASIFGIERKLIFSAPSVVQAGGTKSQLVLGMYLYVLLHLSVVNPEFLIFSRVKSNKTIPIPPKNPVRLRNTMFFSSRCS